MSVIIFLPEGLIYNTFRFNALYTLIFSKKWKYHEVLRIQVHTKKIIVRVLLAYKHAG
jgi:hypothetical protein